MSRCDIGQLSLQAEATPELLLQTDFNERDLVLSPDGRFMAYGSNASGRDEVFVRPFPDVDAGRWPVSTNGGTAPVWGPDGQELIYRSLEGLMAVPVVTEPTFTAGNPELLFELAAYAGGPWRNYAFPQTANDSSW